MPYFVKEIFEFPDNFKKEDVKNQDEKKTKLIHSGLALI
jgi:hypothetical protein